MYDCAKEIVGYHDEMVTLSRSQRSEMRNCRNANRDRLISRLSSDNLELPEKFIKQGSYAMLTMVKEPDNDYDIDDGVYFSQTVLKDEEGFDLSPYDVRLMVCNALKDGRLNKQPIVKKNCVRIFYEEGYHVDMPVYRISEYNLQYELASGNEWVISRAADVENWFDTVNRSKSPDEINGRQFRRIVRLIKKLSRSRDSWKSKIASGFVITKLVEECYVASGGRDDVALRLTMAGIYNRLVYNLEVKHPVTPGAMLTKIPNDGRTAFLRDKLSNALNILTILDDSSCTKNDALSAWDQVFYTDYFCSHYGKHHADSTEVANVTILENLLSKRENPQVVDKQGGGRFG